MSAIANDVRWTETKNTQPLGQEGQAKHSTHYETRTITETWHLSAAPRAALD